MSTGLLLTPGIYRMDVPIVINTSGFVMLGIGFPTLVSQRGRSTVVVASGLSNVRVAGVLLESGTPNSNTSAVPTQPLLQWGAPPPTPGGTHSIPTGSSGNVLSDVFARVGAFAYTTPFKKSCMATRADVMVEINTNGVIVDNTWFWHADHDDCGSASDRSYSAHGLVVNGDDVVVYGLSSEHQMDDLVLWTGDRGRVYFFQSELPYNDNSFGQ